MNNLPLRKSERETYAPFFESMGESISLLYRNCQTLGNLLAGMDGNHDYEAIAQEFEGQSLEKLPALQAAHYLSVLLSDRIGAFLTPLHVAIDMYRDCLNDGSLPDSELSDTVLESMKPAAVAQHFRNAPSHIAFIPAEKQRSYTWTDMLDTLRAEIEKTDLTPENKDALNTVLQQIQEGFSHILNKREALQRLTTHLNPPQELRGRG